MIDPELRLKGAKLTKKVAESSEDVRQLFRFLDEFLNQSSSWTDEDNLLEARGILCSISIRIGKHAKMFSTDFAKERTPRVKAWFNYGGSIPYLNKRKEPLDLITFREAMGDTLPTSKRSQEIDEPQGEQKERGAETHRAKAKQGEVPRIPRPASEGNGGDPLKRGMARDDEWVEESGSDGSEYMGDPPKPRKVQNVDTTEEKPKPVPKASKKTKKRKSPATVDTTGEEDNHPDSGPSKRTKQDPDKLGRYDPACDRCLAENKRDCVYIRFGNACQRCKPSKLKCSYAKGVRSSAKTANPTSMAGPPRDVGKPTTKTTSHVDTPIGENASDKAPPEKRVQPNVAPKPRGADSRERKGLSKNKALATAEDLGIHTPGIPVPLTIYALDGRKMGQVLVGDGPLGPQVLKPRSKIVAPSNEVELAPDTTRQTLACVRERQHMFEHRLADVEARTSTVIRELRWYQSDREALRKLDAVTDAHDGDIVDFGEKHNKSIDHIAQLAQEAETTKAELLQRIQKVESNRGDTARVRALEDKVNKAERDSDESVRTMQEEARLRDQDIDGRVDSVEARVSKAEASAQAVMKKTDELSKDKKAFEDRLERAEGDVKEAGDVRESIGEIRALVEVGQTQGQGLAERLERIERAVSVIVDAMEGLKTNRDNATGGQIGTMFANIQAQCSDIGRRLDHIETDHRHVKSAVDINAMSLNNALRTIMFGIKAEGVHARQETQTQLFSIRQDIDAQLDSFRRFVSSQWAWNSPRDGPGIPGMAQHGAYQGMGATLSGQSRHQGGFVVGMGQHPGQNLGGYGMGGNLQLPTGPEEQVDREVFWAGPVNAQSGVSLDGFGGNSAMFGPTTGDATGDGEHSPGRMSPILPGVSPVPGGLLASLQAPLRDEDLAFNPDLAPTTAQNSAEPQSVSGWSRPNRPVDTRSRGASEGGPNKGKGRQLEQEDGEMDEEEMLLDPNQSTVVNIDAISSRGSLISGVGPSTRFSHYSPFVNRGSTASSSPLTSLPPTPPQPSTASDDSNPDNL